MGGWVGRWMGGWVGGWVGGCHSWVWTFPFLPNVGTKVMCFSADLPAEKGPREGCVLGLISGLS